MGWLIGVRSLVRRANRHNGSESNQVPRKSHADLTQHDHAVLEAPQKVRGNRLALRTSIRSNNQLSHIEIRPVAGRVVFIPKMTSNKRSSSDLPGTNELSFRYFNLEMEPLSGGTALS